MLTSSNIPQEKQIKLLSIGLTILYIARFLMDWELTKLTFIYYRDWDLSSFTFLLPKFLYPIGLWGLWSVRKYGWIIVTMLITYSTISSLVSLLFEIKWSFEDSVNETDILPLSPIIDEIFGRGSILFSLAQLVFAGIILLYINSKSVTELFKISRRTQFVIIGLVSAPVLIQGLILII